jgi:hypothetical protein
MFTSKKNILEYFGTPPARSGTGFGILGKISDQNRPLKFSKIFKNIFLLA